MTLKQIIGTIKNLAKKHPNVNSTYEGNIYDILNANPSNKYASVVLTQTTHTQDEMFDHYGFVIFYVDRLVDDVEDNRVQIQSIGKSMLTNIVEAFCYEFDAEHNDITFHPFTQKFADETAGVYIDIVIDTPKDSICAERYWDEQWSAPIITIKNATEQIHITDNGRFEVTYDPTNYTGLEKVIIDVEFDTNPYYEEGYNNGYEEGGEQGYVNGFTNGVDDQKNKLESITITENGSYSREDGYNEIIVDVPDTNGSYDEGYSDGYINGDGDGYHRGYVEGEANGIENAGEIIAQTAQVLNITENGEYKTRYSDPFIPESDVTGYFDDGTKFNDYAYLKEQVFDTGIAATEDTRLEFWYKFTNEKTGDAWQIIVGAGEKDDSKVYQIRHLGLLYFQIGNSILTTEKLKTNEWQHFVVSKAEGVFIDGEKIGDLNYSSAPTGTFYINGAGYTLDRNINGYFGMIKIDDQIFIPTEEGFKNYTTGELLEVVKNGEYDYTNISPIYGEGNLIKTVNVNIQPKINVKDSGIKFSYSTFSKIPEYYDFEGITDMSNMFQYCKQLKTIPLIDTSNVKTFSYAFKDSGITEIPLLNTSNCTDFTYCFCATKITELPQLDLSKGKSFYEFCYNSYDLKYVPNLDLSSATGISGLLENCNALISVGEIIVPNVTSNVTYFLGGATKNNLTDFGGLIGLRGSITSDGFNTCPNLTYQSCINILNGLYDFTGNGETPSSNQGQLKVHQNFIDTVGDEISIATNKGWQLTV